MPCVREACSNGQHPGAIVRACSVGMSLPHPDVLRCRSCWPRCADVTDPAPPASPPGGHQAFAGAAGHVLVGRDAERLQLANQLDSARQGGGQVLVVLGEAGIGKSALLDDLAAQV